MVINLSRDISYSKCTVNFDGGKSAGVILDYANKQNSITRNKTSQPFLIKVNCWY